MPQDSHEFDEFLRPAGWEAEKAELVAENLRLRHALTIALADYETVNMALATFNIPLHPFTLTPELIGQALGVREVSDPSPG